MTKLADLMQHSHQSLVQAYDRRPKTVLISMQSLAIKDFELAA